MCGGGREHHGEWEVCCPAHDDHRPSLTIGYDHDRVLLHCYVGCDPHHILHRLGLMWKDLFDDGQDREPPPKRAKHLGPRIPEPPGGPTQDNIALQVALEMIIDDCRLLEVEACQALFRRIAANPLLKLWIEQQLRRHQLAPALVWQLIQLAPPAATGLRTVAVTSLSRKAEGGAA
jgi:hypothetical protein